MRFVSYGRPSELSANNTRTQVNSRTVSRVYCSRDNSTALSLVKNLWLWLTECKGIIVWARAMDDPQCADCKMLQQAALVAVLRHNYAPSRLAIGKMRHDSPKKRFFEPVVEQLLQERSAAVRAYQEHVDRHGQKESAGTGII